MPRCATAPNFGACGRAVALCATRIRKHSAVEHLLSDTRRIRDGILRNARSAWQYDEVRQSTVSRPPTVRKFYLRDALFACTMHCLAIHELIHDLHIAQLKSSVAATL